MTSIFLKNVCTFHQRAFHSQLQMLIWPIASCCPCQCFLFHQLYSTHFVVCWVLHVTIVSTIVSLLVEVDDILTCVMICSQVRPAWVILNEVVHIMWEKAHSIQFQWNSLSLECPIQLKDKQVQYKRHPQLNTILRPWSEPPFTAALVGQRIANGSSSFLKYDLVIWNWKWSFKYGHFFPKVLTILNHTFDFCVKIIDDRY